MDDKIKVVIGVILIILAIVFYLLSQVSQTLDNVGTNLLLIFMAGIAAIAGIFIIQKYLPKIF